MLIDKINDIKMKLGSNVTLRTAGKTKVDSEISVKADNSAKRKRVEEAMDMGQGDDRLPGTDRMLTDVAIVPPILMAGLKSASYKTKRKDHSLVGATSEMKILSQCGESTLKGFKPSSMNYGKGSVVGQLVPVEYNRLTVSETVSIDEPAGGCMEMVEYRNSARGHLIALENKSAMEGYLETMIQDTTMKQKAYKTLVSSEMHAETIEYLVSLPWRAVVLRHLEEEMRTNPKDTRSDSDNLCENRIATQVRLVHDRTDTGGKRLRSQENIEGREDNLNDEHEISNDLRRSGSSVREAERRSLFHSIHAGTNISAGVELLCQDAKGRR